MTEFTICPKFSEVMCALSKCCACLQVEVGEEFRVRSGGITVQLQGFEGFAGATHHPTRHTQSILLLHISLVCLQRCCCTHCARHLHARHLGGLAMMQGHSQVNSELETIEGAHIHHLAQEIITYIPSTLYLLP